MAAKPVALAKFTRPRLHAAAARGRLFAVLDGFRDHPVVWIAGPPGAGKTTLTATWIENRSLPGIWYQLDSGDSDPATFFYYLKQAAEAAGAKGKVPLPLLTPEYLADIPGFTRRWFRELFARLPEGAVLALDNYQEIHADSPLHKALAAACEELPEGSQLLAMSWVRAPPAYSRLSVTQRLAEVDREDLKLTSTEATEIAHGSEGISAEQAAELNHGCEGWAAGFTLMRERLRRTGLIDRIDLPGSMQQVFDYFVGQAFADATPENREALVATAIFPRFTEAMARQFTGNAKVGELLEWLYQRHLFIDRRYGDEVTYQYHTLFRAFLKDQARRRYTAERLAELARRAAAILESTHPDEAVALRLEANDSAGATALILTQAEGMLAAGRGQTVRDWIGALKDEALERQPWLRYWDGMATIGVAPVRARTAFERAFDDFKRLDDCTGQVAAAAAVLETLVLEHRDLRPGANYMAQVEAVLPKAGGFPSAEVEARVLGGLISFQFYHMPTSALLAPCVDDLFRRLDSPLEPNQKVVAACYLLEYLGMAGYREESLAVIRLVQAALADPATTELSRAMWCIRAGVHWVFAGNPDLAEKAYAEADGLLERNGFGFMRVLLLRRRVDLAFERWDSAKAIAPFRELMNAASHADGAQVLGPTASRAKFAADCGNAIEAVRIAREGYEVARHGGFTLFALYSGLLLAWALLEIGQHDESNAVLDEIAPDFPVAAYPTLGEHETRFIRVCNEALRGASGDWRTSLAAELGQQQAIGCLNPLPLIPRGTRRLCEIALAEDIERDYVVRVIRTWKIVPSVPDIPNWPWPVKLRTLGTLEIRIDDSPLAFTGKAPKKPLELLQALVAFGGKGVSAETLCNALWPDSEADAADTSLRVTLSRLRKLLGHDEVITFSEGKLSLDDDLCWVDAGSLQRAFGKIEALRPDAAVESVEALAAGLLDLYRGGFLEKEREQPWMLPLRETLRRRFIGAVAEVGGRLERNGAPQRALALYERAIAQDPVAEPIYRHLMSAQLALGQKSEALNAYRRCREMLSIVLGVKPSAETEALAARARQ